MLTGDAHCFLAVRRLADHPWSPRPAFTSTADGVAIAYATTGSGATHVHLPGVPLSNREAGWRIPGVRHRKGDRPTTGDRPGLEAASQARRAT
jgi:hypothetical protein